MARHSAGLQKEKDRRGRERKIFIKRELDLKRKRDR